MNVGSLILLVQCLLGTSVAMTCREVPGSLKQIDAGVGQVFGVNDKNLIYTFYGGTWTKLPGTLKHVSVGPSGVWGANRNNYIYKLVGANWVRVPGLLKQVDAGGDQFAAGVNMHDNVYCLGRDATVGFSRGNSPAPWQRLPGALMYYSCGPNGCWGVNSKQDIYLMKGVTPTACMGSKDWQKIEGKLVMIEVGTDGSVYGVNAGGDVYRRDGITTSNPAGTGWTHLSLSVKSKHVSYDLGHLWVITSENKIMDCTIGQDNGLHHVTGQDIEVHHVTGQDKEVHHVTGQDKEVHHVTGQDIEVHHVTVIVQDNELHHVTEQDKEVHLSTPLQSLVGP